MVEDRIREWTFKELVDQCKEKKKVTSLSYKAFQRQKYLEDTKPELAYIIARMRCQMLDLKSDRPYLFDVKSGSTCRLCGIGNESLSHIINCYVVSDKVCELDCPKIYKDSNDIKYMKEVATTVNAFFMELEMMD